MSDTDKASDQLLASIRKTKTTAAAGKKVADSEPAAEKKPVAKKTAKKAAAKKTTKKTAPKTAPAKKAADKPTGYLKSSNTRWPD